MKIKLYFDDGTSYLYELTHTFHDIVIEQMQRKPEKRLYSCGIEFSKVIKAEVGQ